MFSVDQSPAMLDELKSAMRSPSLECRQSANPDDNGMYSCIQWGSFGLISPWTDCQKGVFKLILITGKAKWNDIRKLDEREEYRVPFRSITPFLLITFGLAWSILALYIFLPEPMGNVFGQLTGNHPLFFLAVYSPAIAAFVLVARNGGLPGLRRFLGRALLWRCGWAWYVFLLVGIPLIFIGGSAIRGNLFTEPFPFGSFQALIVGLFLAAIKGPVEEFGWRGLALPLLQRKFAPIWAGLILGAIWGLWHMPAFLLSGTQQSEWSFAAFFAGCLAISVIATALFNRSRGSILLTAFFHFSLMNPVFPDAQPYDTYMLIVAACLIVWWNRKDMFAREGSVTEVIPIGC